MDFISGMLIGIVIGVVIGGLCNMAKDENEELIVEVEEDKEEK